MKGQVVNLIPRWKLMSKAYKLTTKVEWQLCWNGIGKRGQRRSLQITPVKGKAKPLKVDMEVLEALLFEVEEQVFGLTVEELREICPLLDISVTEGQPWPSIVRLVQSSLRKMDLGKDAAEEQLRAVQAGLDILKHTKQAPPNVNQEVQVLVNSHQSKMAQLQSKLRLLQDHLDQKKSPSETSSAQAPLPFSAATITSSMNAPPPPLLQGAKDQQPNQWTEPERPAELYEHQSSKRGSFAQKL